MSAELSIQICPAEIAAQIANPSRRIWGLHRRPCSLTTYLIAFLGAAVIPFLAMLVLVTAQYMTAQRARLESLAKLRLEHIAATFDRDLTSKIGMLEALATSPALRNDDLGGFYQQTLNLSELQGVYVVLRDVDNRQLINTRFPWGTELPYGLGITLENNNDLAAVTTGRPQISDLYRGATTGEYRVNVTVPVLHEGRLRYYLSATFDPNYFANVFDSLQLPKDYFSSLADRNGFIISHSTKAREFVGSALPGADNGDVPSARWSGVKAQSVRVSGFAKRSDISGWVITLGVSQQSLERPLWKSLYTLAALALALLALGTAAVVGIKRMITTAFERVGLLAGKASERGTVEAPVTEIREANHLSRTLADALNSLHEKAEQLDQLNRELEQKVDERTRALAHQAQHDSLTELPNRTLLRQRLDMTLGDVRQTRCRVVMLLLDLDHFKEVNDTLGHPVGDELLKAVAVRLRASVRATSTIARLGGDEFAIIEQSDDPIVDASELAERILNVLSTPFMLLGHQVVAGSSIGIAVACPDHGDADDLIRNADLALYRAKQNGRGTYCFFESEMQKLAQERRDLERDLKSAIENGEFELQFQPILNLERDRISSCEALLRWRHPTRGSILPGEFIPLAEDTGLIGAIGAWVLQKACAEAAGWPDDVKIAVNLSPAQFKRQQLQPIVAGALAASGLAAHRLELEVTESVILQDTTSTMGTLHRLHAMGVRIALDDFGTGYSSLSFLRMFPFDKIKIDRSFISDLAHGKQESQAVVRSLVRLAVELGKTTTAEGVETQSLFDLVRAEGCTEVQGYYFHRPMPSADVRALLEAAAKKLSEAA